MDLSAIRREHVLAALAEADRLGRDAFLAAYGYERARQYVLIHDGVHYDSKAVVGVAHKHAAGRPLLAREFSGGRATVQRLLENLGFEVSTEVTRAEARLLGHLAALRTAPTPEGPARHQPLLLLWAMGRAGRRLPRLLPWSEVRADLVELLRAHGHPSSRPRADYPFLALANTPLWELQGHTGHPPRAHGDAELLRWLDAHDPRGGLTGWAYELVAGSPSTRAEATAVLLDRFFAETDAASLLREVGLSPDVPEPADDAAAAYRRLVESVEATERLGRRGTTPSTRETPTRSRMARQAVLLRCGGRCENPICAGQPDDVNARGEPLLEVDHVAPLAGGGRDHPIQMIALCPNCHAVKTRGRTGPELSELLRTEARQRHGAWTEVWPNTYVSPEVLQSADTPPEPWTGTRP